MQRVQREMRLEKTHEGQSIRVQLLGEVWFLYLEENGNYKGFSVEE